MFDTQVPSRSTAQRPCRSTAVDNRNAVPCSPRRSVGPIGRESASGPDLPVDKIEDMVADRPQDSPEVQIPHIYFGSQLTHLEE